MNMNININNDKPEIDILEKKFKSDFLFESSREYFVKLLKLYFNEAFDIFNITK